jgi:succinylglutamate desuccinylase
MSADDHSPPTGATQPQRVIGDQGDPSLGATLVIIGGMHGNEPAGVEACREVMRILGERKTEIRGRVLALVGNRAAVARKQRFLLRDLNRRWTPERLGHLREQSSRLDLGEDGEQRELVRLLREAADRATGPITLLDLHSTSADCPPFCCMADALRHRPLAFGLGVPVILGLEEATDETLMGYLADQGHIGVAFEAGQHEDPETLLRHVAAIWVSLVGSGLISSDDAPGYDAHVRRLRDAAKNMPRVVEIVYRHGIRPEDDFAMRPGFMSFQPLSDGDLLAQDRGGEVRAAYGGRVLLPLYQGLGEDGFFIARDVGKLRLGLSSLLRRFHFDRLLHWLPGVRRPQHGQPNQLLVSRSANIRWLRSLLFLCGYRRSVPQGDLVRYSRRRPDADGVAGTIGY